MKEDFSKTNEIITVQKEMGNGLSLQTTGA